MNQQHEGHDLPEQPSDPTGASRWRRPVVLTIAIAVTIWVLFTWVFPWVTEMGLSPVME